MIAPQLLGIDAGGTFTDFVYLRTTASGSEVIVHKVLSTPAAPEVAILTGLEQMGLMALAENGELHIVHGSTVATNAALEGRGVRTAFITNRGFGDMLTLARQTRPALYGLEFPPRQLPVPPELCLEVGGRRGADGSEVEPLEQSDIETLCRQLVALQPRAVAINLLFSFLDASHEKVLVEAIETSVPDAFVCRSSEVLPEYREYERGIATWLNASLGPIVSGYIDSLRERLGECPLMIMQSSGETLSARVAARRAVNLLLSGPAGGLSAISFLGRQIGEFRFISFDMGGTSTDVALIEGEAQITNEGRIADYPVAVPMVDMHTIGAGGGSIAFIDGGGMLRVGPKSAGADPGPACYGKGGSEPTVTDANVVLGRIPASASLAGSYRIDAEAAVRAIESLARKANLGTEETALGIIRVANENMAGALRMISVQRGFDPADFILSCFGGAGGLHVCALADAMAMDNALVPVNAGVLSALGMLVAPRGRQFSRTVRVAASQASTADLEAAFEELVSQGGSELLAEGVAGTHNDLSADMCYTGQSSTLNLPWQGVQANVDSFHKLHRARYGFELDRDIEFVNLRARLIEERPQQQPEVLALHRNGNKKPLSEVYHEAGGFPVYARDALAEGETIQGPAIVSEMSATTFIDRHWSGQLDRFGNLRLSRTGF